MSLRIEDYISKGHSNAISREELCARTGLEDRMNRRLISEAVEYRHIPIINVGYGYFIPDGSKEDESELYSYYRKEKSRAIKIFSRLETIKDAVNFDPNQEVLNG